MKFYKFITEDYETVREYKKAIFDLKVAMGEKEFMEGEKIENDPERRRRQKEGLVNIKKRIIALKEKIQKMAQELGESIDPKLQEVLDKIPNKKDIESKKEISESVMFSKDRINSVLYQDINKILDDMLKVDDSDYSKWSRLNNKAKKEFKRLGVTGVDYHGYVDIYYSTKK